MNQLTQHKSNPLKSSQGQQASPLALQFEELSLNEQIVIAALAHPERPVKTIKQITQECGWEEVNGSKARGNSRVRNSLRRLVRSHWVEHENHIGDGKYRLTSGALKKLMKIVDG